MFLKRVYYIEFSKSVVFPTFYFTHAFFHTNEKKPPANNNRLFYRSIPKTFLTISPTAKEIAATPILIPIITKKLRRNGLPFVMEI